MGESSELIADIKNYLDNFFSPSCSPQRTVYKCASNTRYGECRLLKKRFNTIRSLTKVGNTTKDRNEVLIVTPTSNSSV